MIYGTSNHSPIVSQCVSNTPIQCSILSYLFFFQIKVIQDNTHQRLFRCDSIGKAAAFKRSLKGLTAQNLYKQQYWIFNLLHKITLKREGWSKLQSLARSLHNDQGKIYFFAFNLHSYWSWLCQVVSTLSYKTKFCKRCF